jgi:hypothetical protein
MYGVRRLPARVLSAGSPDETANSLFNPRRFQRKWRTQVAAGRTIDIPDLVPKSGDDTAPARSDG